MSEESYVFTPGDPWAYTTPGYGLPAAERLPGGGWLITDAHWPASRMREAVWRPGRYGWMVDPVIRPSATIRITSV